MDFDVLTFVGRFQPFHNGHRAVIDEALRRSRKVAIVLGSHDQPRNPRNPFTTAERIEMISLIYPDEVRDGRIEFVPQVDHTYNHDRWISGIQAGVDAVARTPFDTTEARIGLIGHAKDHTSFYLKFFPNWDSLAVANVDGIDATSIRAKYFRDGKCPAFKLPGPIIQWLSNWRNTPEYRQIQAETLFIAEYKRQWESVPYAPTFVTVDAIVVQSGHILLVRRGAQPGKGLWALPGGFLDPRETLKQGMLRELREETKIAVPGAVLEGSIVDQRTFDDPNRSERGRTITTAFYIRLRDEEKLPKIKGSDDADKAVWTPLSALTRRNMYEDHFDMIEAMVAI